jgi:hypothetical protein
LTEGSRAVPEESLEDEEEVEVERDMKFLIRRPSRFTVTKRAR